MREDRQELRRQWERDGFFVARGVVDAKQVRSLSSACDHALHKMRTASNETGHTTTHLSGFLLPEHYVDRPAHLDELVSFVSSPSVVSMIRDLGQHPEGLPSLRDVQYFHEPTARSWDGPWHRDRDVTEASTRADTLLLRFRVAFADDDNLEYVAGSHARPDTEEEMRVRKGAVRNLPLSGGVSRILLHPGDVCVFDTRGVHRGCYRHDRPRRTLDLLFDFATPQTQMRLRSELARRFMARFE